MEIILPAGATFIENLELKVPQGNNYITLKSSALNNLPRGVRANRSQISNFPTIKSPLNNANTSALRTELKNSSGSGCSTSQTCQPAHHYRLQGIQFTVSPGTLPNGVYENIVILGTDFSNQNEVSEQAHHFIVDRSLIFSDYYSAATNPNPQRVKNGMELHAANVSVLDSNISGISSEDGATDSHAISSYNSFGVWGIVNNYLEASHISILIGGQDPTVPNATPTYVEFRRNRCHKPLELRNLPFEHRWFAKNNFEMKTGKNWVIEENMFDGNWVGNNQLWTVVFAALGGESAPYIDVITVQDIQFTTNIIKQGPRGIFIGRSEELQTAPPLTRFLISNNLISEIGGSQYGCNTSTPGCDPSAESGADGLGFTVNNFTPTNLIIRHNTILGKHGILGVYPSNSTPIALKDNIMKHGDYGIYSDRLPGNDTFNHFFPNSEVIKNLIADTNISPYPNPAQNYYCSSSASPPLCDPNIDAHFVDRSTGNYRISSTSPGKNGASDALDVGADIDKIDIVSANAVSGNWGIASTNQTPYPGPNIPGGLRGITLEVENFDNGGQGVAYNDIFGGTGSGAYRSNPVEAVDIQARSTAGNGFAVYEAAAGEWLEYTTRVQQAGLFNISVAYASEFNGGKFRLEDCGSDPNNNNCVDITGLLTTNSTGNWGTFSNVTRKGVRLAAGIHVIRLVMVTNSPDGCNCIVANFDKISFEPLESR